MNGTYGSPRITAERRDAGPRVNHKRVERVMRVFGIAGVHLRKKARTTVPTPSRQTMPDLIKRDFTAPAPNQRYVGDITYLPIGDGEFLYLATVIDLCSRRLVGWSIADPMRTDLVTDALEAAARTRRGRLDGAIFHSDHGAQYASARLRERLRPARGHPVDLAGSGGFFVDVIIHDLDTARWMVAEIVEVSPYGTAVADPAIGSIGDIDTALVVLRFESGRWA